MVEFMFLEGSPLKSAAQQNNDKGKDNGEHDRLT